MVNTSSQSGDVVWLVDSKQVVEDLQDVEEGQTQSTTLDVGQFSVLPLEEVGEGGYHLKTGLLIKSTTLVSLVSLHLYPPFLINVSNRQNLLKLNFVRCRLDHTEAPTECHSCARGLQC